METDNPYASPMERGAESGEDLWGFVLRVGLGLFYVLGGIGAACDAYRVHEKNGWPVSVYFVMSILICGGSVAFGCYLMLNRFSQTTEVSQ